MRLQLLVVKIHVVLVLDQMRWIVLYHLMLEPPILGYMLKDREGHSIQASCKDKVDVHTGGG